MFASIHAPGVSQAVLVECARAFSPRLGSAAADTVVLDANGLNRLFGTPAELAGAIARRAAEMGLPASVGLASTPEAAAHAARGFRGVTVVPPGREAELLGKLPVAALTPFPELARTLAQWGIKTLRELAALPEEGLAERLGPEGVRLHQLARGCGIRPLVPDLPAPVFEETLELEDPVELLEPLAFLLARLLADLCARLERHGLAPQELRLQLKLADGCAHERVIRLPVPIRDSRALLKLLRLDLEAHPPRAPIAGVTLAAEPGRPRVLQDGLFLPLAPEPAKLEVTLRRIAGLVGKGNVGWPELEDTHRPDAFRLKNRGQATPSLRGRRSLSPVFLALRRFRPPLKAEVEAPGGRPVKILARQVHGRVLAAAGPWRTAGEWWTPQAWDRDEFDVALSDGALYRLFRDRRRAVWFVEGSYD